MRTIVLFLALVISILNLTEKLTGISALKADVRNVEQDSIEDMELISGQIEPDLDLDRKKSGKSKKGKGKKGKGKMGKGGKGKGSGRYISKKDMYKFYKERLGKYNSADDEEKLVLIKKHIDAFVKRFGIKNLDPNYECFAGTNKVETKTGIKHISELVIGDFIRTSTGEFDTHFTEFLGWMLRQKSSPVEMLQVLTTQGVSSLTLTANHIVFTPTSTKYADELVPGDSLVFWNGSQIVDEVVTEIQKTVVMGSWSPLTRDGTLLVDGYLASCYASFPHKLSDLAMIPVKVMPTLLLDNEESQHEDGIRPVVKLMKKVGEWIGARERNLKIKELAPPSIDTQFNHLITKSEF